MTLADFLQPAFFALMLASLGLALWKGGEPERAGALVLVAMWALQSLGVNFLPSRFIAVDPVAFLSDLVGTLGFGAIALNARRFWPLCATALQVLSLSAHFARWADLAIPKLVYALMRSGPTFVVLSVLLIGTVLHLRRLHRDGVDRSWQDWSRGAARSGRQVAGR